MAYAASMYRIYVCQKRSACYDTYNNLESADEGGPAYH